MASSIWSSRYQGGTCYALCQETFQFFNPSIAICWKGCDYGTARVNDEGGRQETNEMCKRLTAESMYTDKGELESLTDLRVHAEMYPTSPDHIYKACLAGVRRQKY